MTERTNIVNDVDLAFLQIAENSFSAMSVLQRTLPQTDNPLVFLETLDDMNIRGEQLWPAFADYCNYRSESFVFAVQHRDECLVEYLNQQIGISHVAVTRGTREARL